MENDDSSTLIPKLIICLIAAASAAVVVTLYHCITTGHIRAILRLSPGNNNRNTPPNRTFILRHNHQQQQQEELQQSSMENSLAELIPSHKYQKGAGLIAENDGMCAVCLSEFEEGEELRTLPECMHSFHAECIDMWLYSHSNCPVCRTNAAPSPQMLMHFFEANLETPHQQRNSPNLTV
ncbi:hypothetical protein ACH5RR_019229 [Cinchona calisaya]|uniref:RING-type E3 ubiquitin transferase n=1 Tax=Cinchona calisaya TaxID=153742 RepID=A0ABD2ZRW3_9GENT